MVDKERVRLWVDALRSGEFTQTQGMLRRANEDGTVGHCCLGVAVEVAMRHQDGLGLTPWANSYREGSTHYANYLPDSVRRWYGFDWENPRLDVRVTPGVGDDESVTATRANDVFELSFEQIAAAVENTYLRA